MVHVVDDTNVVRVWTIGRVEVHFLRPDIAFDRLDGQGVKCRSAASRLRISIFTVEWIGRLPIPHEDQENVHVQDDANGA